MMHVFAICHGVKHKKSKSDQLKAHAVIEAQTHQNSEKMRPWSNPRGILGKEGEISGPSSATVNALVMAKYEHYNFEQASTGNS